LNRARPRETVSGSPDFYTWLSWVGLGQAVLGFILLVPFARPFWALTRSSLLITMAVLVVAIGWSVAAALPWAHYYARAPAGQTWKDDGQPVIEFNCCAVTSATYTLGQKILFGHR
jgi:hypothetical protein